MEIKPINKGIVMLTSACNLACPYCFEQKFEPRNMSFETAKAILDYLQSNCTDNWRARFVFFGGEPLLRYDEVMVPLIEYSKGLKHATDFSMTTNGTLLDIDRIDYLAKNNVRFMLSFDGLRNIQESGRPMKNGESSYDKIIELLPYIKDSHAMFSVRATLLKSWIDQLFPTIEFFDTIDLQNIHILPNIWEDWGEREAAELKYQLGKYENYLIENFRRNHHPIVFSDYAQSFWRITAAMSAKARRVNTACQPEARCGMGVRGSCDFDPDGDMYGCHHIHPMNRDSIWYIGNVHDGLDTDRVNRLISLYNKDKIGNDGCNTCPVDWICDGGCTSTNYLVCGDVNVVPKSFCIWRRLITDSAYRVANILGNEENPLFKWLFTRWC